MMSVSQRKEAEKVEGTFKDSYVSITVVSIVAIQSKFSHD